MTRAQLLAQIEALLSEQEPRIKAAFWQAVYDARASVVLENVIAALERGDINAAAELLQIDRVLLAPLDQMIQSSYVASGNLAMDALIATAPRAMRLVTRFDAGHWEAAQWLRTHSSALVVEIVADQREGIREALRVGMEAGRHPRGVALEVVGRYDKVSKRRVGGLLGLTSQQMGYVANARAELLSGDPAQMRAYLERKQRNKLYDRAVLKAIREGRPVSAADVQKATGRYAANLLRLRGEVIARNEALEAFSHSRDSAARQLVSSGRVRADQIEKDWSATLDGRTRDAHVALHGQRVGLDEAFISPLSGAQMMFPRDGSRGAPAKERILCRCFCQYKVVFIGGLR